jgi:uncharacterized protein
MRHPAQRFSISASEGPGRLAALVWALLHVPILLALFASPIIKAVSSAPAPWGPWIAPTFVAQAALLALVFWLVGLPFSIHRGVYRWAGPAAVALGTALVAVDSRVYGALGYHLNGFFFRLMAQPHALREAGVPPSDLAIAGAIALAFIALDLWAGAAFMRRAGRLRSRRAWTWALALALLATTERVYGAAMVYWGGPAFFAASTVLPLQPPIRMGGIMRKLFGPQRTDPLARSGRPDASRLPAGVPPDAVRFTQRPDVIFLVAESLPGDHLDARTMPRLWERGLSGARFPNYYAGASNTEYGIFSLVYGLHAHKLETVVGSGRQPLLFPALRANGYRVGVLAASCVDWMSLNDTVFGGVQDVLQTWCAGHDPKTTDETMIAAARNAFEAASPDEPVFLFLFFFGTHFNYFYEAQDREFEPEWDGSGGLKATTEPGWKIKNRARNAARTLDRRIDGFLSWVEATRGRAPLVIFTGDHGEEFREKGHIGHGSQVTREQVNTPALWLGPGVPAGVFEAPASSTDVVPTLFSLLGDVHAPAAYSDGISMFDAPLDRFVVSTVGWEPRYAIIGREVKVQMYAGVGAQVTDPDDRPLEDGSDQLVRHAGKMVRALRGEVDAAGAAESPGVAGAAGAPR